MSNEMSVAEVSVSPDGPDVQQSTSLSFNINPWILIIILACIAIIWYFFGSKVSNFFGSKRNKEIELSQVEEHLEEGDDVEEYNEGEEDDEFYGGPEMELLQSGVPLSSLLELLAQANMKNSNMTTIEEIQDDDDEAGYEDEDEDEDKDEDKDQGNKDQGNKDQDKDQDNKDQNNAGLSPKEPDSTNAKAAETGAKSDPITSVKTIKKARKTSKKQA